MISVMIVEDEFLVRAGLRSSIDWEKEGFEIVAEAQNGEDAITLFRKFKPSIIITDIRMPKMDGIQLMKEIRREQEDVSFIVVSAYDDFKYAKESIEIGVTNYFLKGNLDVTEFLKTLHKLREKMDTGITYDKSLHQISLKEVYDSKSVKEFEKAFLVMFCAETANQEMLKSMAENYFLQNNISFINMEADQGKWFVCSSSEKDSKILIRELYHMFQRYVDGKIALGYSKDLNQYPHMKEAIYHTILVYQNNSNSKKIVEFKIDGELFYEKVRELEKKFLDNLRFHQYKEATEQINRIKMEVIELLSPTTLFRSIYKIIGGIEEYSKDIIASRVYDELMMSMDIQYIFSVLQNFVFQLEEGNEEGNVYIEKAKEFINENYNQVIRIKDLSDYVYVSPNYLGKIFYLNTGKYLKDYINEVKLEKSKELLMKGKYQVSEVASLVGFEDQRYFSKLFKKYYGVSPKDYRVKNKP